MEQPGRQLARGSRLPAEADSEAGLHRPGGRQPASGPPRPSWPPSRPSPPGTASPSHCATGSPWCPACRGSPPPLLPPGTSAVACRRLQCSRPRLSRRPPAGPAPLRGQLAAPPFPAGPPSSTSPLQPPPPPAREPAGRGTGVGTPVLPQRPGSQRTSSPRTRG